MWPLITWVVGHARLASCDEHVFRQQDLSLAHRGILRPLRAFCSRRPPRGFLGGPGELRPETNAAPVPCRVRPVSTLSTKSRRPSAAAGCARLASLAVLAGQHQDVAHGAVPAALHAPGPARSTAYSLGSRASSTRGLASEHAGRHAHQHRAPRGRSDLARRRGAPAELHRSSENELQRPSVGLRDARSRGAIIGTREATFDADIPRLHQPFASEHGRRDNGRDLTAPSRMSLGTSGAAVLQTG
jgi:hypothetical protein